MLFCYCCLNSFVVWMKFCALFCCQLTQFNIFIVLNCWDHLYMCCTTKNCILSESKLFLAKKKGRNHMEQLKVFIEFEKDNLKIWLNFHHSLSPCFVGDLTRGFTIVFLTLNTPDKCSKRHREDAKSC